MIFLGGSRLTPVAIGNSSLNWYPFRPPFAKKRELVPQALVSGNILKGSRKLLQAIRETPLRGRLSGSKPHCAVEPKCPETKPMNAQMCQRRICLNGGFTPIKTCHKRAELFESICANMSFFDAYCTCFRAGLFEVND